MPCRKLELPKLPSGISLGASISNFVDLFKISPPPNAARRPLPHEARAPKTFSSPNKDYQSAYSFIRVFSVKILKGFMRSVEGFYNLPLFKSREIYRGYIYVCLYNNYPIISYSE